MLPFGAKALRHANRPARNRAKRARLMWKSLFAAAILAASLAPAFGEECLLPSEEDNPPQHVLYGTVVITASTEANDGLGEPIGTKFLALALDKPVCITINAKPEHMSILRLLSMNKQIPVDSEKPATWPKMLGQHVAASGSIQLDETVLFQATRLQANGRSAY
jgi:hypothetical protein